jgi:hypothetical protein
MFVTA